MANPGITAPVPAAGVGFTYDPVYGKLFYFRGQYYSPDQAAGYETSEAGTVYQDVVRGAQPFVPDQQSATLKQAPAGYMTVQEAAATKGGGTAEKPQSLFEIYEKEGWANLLPQLGFQGEVRRTTYFKDDSVEGGVNHTYDFTPEAQAFIKDLKQQGYQIAVDRNKVWSGKKYATNFALADPQGNIIANWETKEGSYFDQLGPMLSAFAPAFLGVAGISAQSIGASITGQTTNTLLNNAVGGAVLGGAKNLITSGGDVKSAIKGALTGGALGAAAELVQPYIKEVENALSQLTGDEVAQLAGADVAATDVAGNVGDVDVGGVGDLGVPAGVEQMSSVANFSPEAMQTYANEIAAGASRDLAYARAALVENQLQAAQSIYNRTMTPDVADAMLVGGSAPPVVNNLAGAAAPVTPPPANALISDPYAGLAENFPVSQAPVDFTPQPVAPSPGVATVDLTGAQAPYDPYTGLAENFPTTTPPIIPPTTTAGLGTAGTAAGVAGAGAAAGAAGASGQMTAADLEGLDPNLTLGGGTDVLGGTDVTGGTGAIVAGAAGGAGAGAIAAGGAGAAAAGLTGIPVVDDFLAYLGTPAGAAALGAFGSLASGYLTGQAAKDAAQILADSAANALKLQQDQFDYQKSLLEPYRRRGEAALNRLAGVMGLDGQPAQPQQLLEMDPGYAFRLGEGMKALERVQAARGNMLSGGAIKAGQRYAQDFASGEYGNAYNRLANIAGLGQTVGGQLGTAAQQFGQTAGETMSQGANALAAGRIGRTSGYMGGIGGAVGAYQNYQNQQQQNQLFRDIYGRMGL